MIKTKSIINCFLKVGYLLRFANPFCYRGWKRILAVSFAMLIAFSAALPLADKYIEKKLYALDSKTLALLSEPNHNLAAKFKHDSSKQMYTFNGDAKRDAAASPIDQLKSQVGGGGKDSESLYSVDLPTDISKGMTLYDNNLQVSFTMVPVGVTGTGKLESGRLIYPLGNGIKAIYTAMSNGIKEDIILPHAPENGETLYRYQLKLPETLEARLVDDGSGDLGIYSGDPALFGNVTFGSDKDEEKITSARRMAKKTHLVFAIPAPVIGQNGGDKDLKGASAKFLLSKDGDLLTVTATGLQSLQYPITIDPSVIVTSSADFATGNNEGNVEFGADEIKRGGLIGGTTSTYTATTAFTTARSGQTSVYFNGYLYVIGGIAGGVYLDTVQYAPVTSTGTVGIWTPTSSFTTGRSSHGSVTYNGYLYVIAGNSAGTSQSDVQYAPINANGSLGAFSPTSGIITARHQTSTVVFNNYVYVLGGINSATATNLASVEYAPIKANGSLGIWTATTSFTTARYGHTSVAYNGFLYVLSGYTTVNITDVQFAPLNTDGTVGNWVITTSVPTARNGHTSIVNKGYVYIIGGNGATAVINTVQVAPLYANGTVGAWTTTSPFSVARANHSSIVVSDYIYVIGGFSATAAQAGVQSSKINAAGSLSPFAVSTNPAVARAWAGSVAMNGYLYSIGGCTAVSADDCSTATTTVSMTKIDENGVLGAWSDTTDALPAALGMGAAVGYNGYLYYVGGRPDAATISPAIYYAPVSSSTGNTTAAWTAIAAPTGLVATWGHSVATYANNLYVLGGCTSTASTCSAFSNTVSYAKLNPAGGLAANPSCVNNFCPLTSFSVARWGHGATIANGKLYVQGGLHATSDTLCNTAASTLCSDVQYATIAADGTLSVWAATANATLAVYGHGFVQNNGYLYVSSGKTATGTFTTNTYFALLTNTGSVATDSGCGTAWCSTLGPSVARGGSVSAAANGRLFMISGQSALAAVNAAGYMNVINNSGPGTVGLSTQQTAAFLAARSGQTTIVNNGYLYIIGGNDTAPRNDIIYCPITNSGSVGACTQKLNAFSTPRAKHTSVVAENYLYIIGGVSGGTQLNDIQACPLATDASVGACTQKLNAFSTPRDSHSSSFFNGYLYIIGGFNTGLSYQNDIQYCLISAGAVGACTQQTNAFTNARASHSSVVANGYLYIIGGETTGNVYVNDILYCPLNTGGVVGTCTQKLDAFTTRRADHTTEVANGIIYITGGNNGNYLSDITTCALGALGTINTCSEKAGAFTTGRSDHSSTVYGGRLYIVGGRDLSNVYNDVQNVPINSISRSATYSKLVDLGLATTLGGISFTGDLPHGKAAITFKTAGIDGVFGVSQSATVLGETCATGTAARYVLVRISMDDSGRVTFADANSPTSFIQDITLSYLSGGAAGIDPAKRLYGGKHFDTEILQPLDTTKITGPGGC